MPKIAKRSTKSVAPAKPAEIRAAEKRGEARIVKLVERTGSPKVRKMKGLIVDMAKQFKGKPAELAKFYTTVERMLVDKQKQIRENRERAIRDLHLGFETLKEGRDLLSQMEAGKLCHRDPETLVSLALAYVVNAGDNIEQSLRDLGVLKQAQAAQ